MNKTIKFVPILLGMLICAVSCAEKPKCPQDIRGDIPIAVNLPHEHCGLFYKCDHGNPIEQACPEGLHFNPEIEICDYPEEAGCTGIKLDNLALKLSEKTECPADVEGEIPVHLNLPHKNCGLFYKCDHGIPIEQECPKGLHFNPELEICDYPNVAGCKGNKNNKNGENDENTVIKPPKRTECPPDVEGEIPEHVNLPHKDCGLFYKCDHGIPIEQECPKGLHFNPELEICDYPNVAGCKGNKNGKKPKWSLTFKTG